MSTHLTKPKRLPVTFVAHQKDEQARFCLKVFEELGQTTLPHIGTALGNLHVVIFSSNADFPGQFLCFKQDLFAEYGVKIPEYASGAGGRIAVRAHSLDYLDDNRDRLKGAIASAIQTFRKEPELIGIPAFMLTKQVPNKKHTRTRA